MNLTDTACVVFGPILPSVEDTLTDGTTRQIVTHNETWETMCAEPQ